MHDECTAAVSFVRIVRTVDGCLFREGKSRKLLPYSTAE